MKDLRYHTGYREGYESGLRSANARDRLTWFAIGFVLGGAGAIAITFIHHLHP